MPTRYFLASGASEGYTPLNAFDGALLQAGIGNTNIVKMSSIVPPHCKPISPVTLPPGALVPAAYASIASDIPGEIISAGIAVALPEDENQNGLIMEYSAKGERRKIEETVRNMAMEGMKLRGWEIKDLKSIAIEHKIVKIGAALAAVILWDSSIWHGNSKFTPQVSNFDVWT
jgi:arginine decarboxylase